MEALHLPRGLIIDLVTPLARGGDIDGRGLGRQLDRVIPHVQGLLISSPYMGEGNLLKPEQREELFEKSLVVVRGRAPIFMWISSKTAEKTRETLLSCKKIAENRKYKGPVFWVDTPLYYHSNRGLRRHYEEMISLAEEPFILHNDPDIISSIGTAFKRNNIRTGILKELSILDGIKGLIFFGPLDRAYNYRKAVRSRADFRIYDGDESYFLGHPSLSGVISRGANLAPRSWQKITSSSLSLEGSQGDYPDYLRQVWETGGYLNKLKDIYSGLGPSFIKLVLKDMGVIEDDGMGKESENMSGEVNAVRDLMEKREDYS
jgi:dihydrodipicolinate synthase/N-acetylneuraminate lyase